MPKYEVGVYLTYTQFGSVNIEADSEAKALEVADEMYLNDEIEILGDSKNQLDIMIEEVL
tara:strand:- start:406 stop:585 length:180 start_codon:yes stop_codon:yes gene_type:complete